ncbi:ABC transporter substrate-binding protein [Campylobacterota bacterium DY0563]
MNILRYLLLIVSFTIFSYASQSGELKEVSIQLNWKYQFEFAGFIAAKEKGFYEDAGLSVEIKEFNHGIDIVEDLKSGKSTFSVYDFSVLNFEELKDSLKLVANYFKRSALVFVTKQDIVTPFDLKDKTIMIEQEQLDLSTLNALFRKFSISENDFKFRQHSFNPDDFISGKVDVMSAYLSNEIYEIKKSNVPFNIIDPQSYGIYGSGVNLFTTKKLTQNDPDLIKKFLEATNKGWLYSLEHKKEIVDIIYNKYSKVKTKDALLFEANQIEKLIMPKIYEIGKIDKQLFQKNINEFVNDGLIQKKFDVDDIIYDTSAKNVTELNFTKEQQEYISKKDKITMCIDPDWMPYEKLIDGKHVGMTSEYIPILSKKIGIPIELVPTKTWSESVEFAKSRKCDIFSLASATPSRLTYMNFTSPYVSFPLVIATRNDELFISDPDSLVSEKKLGVVKGYATGEILKRLHPDNKIVDVVNVTEGMQKVAKGELFGFVDALPTIAYTLQHNYIGELKISGKFNYYFELGIGVRNDDIILFELFQKAVQAIDEKDKQRITNSYISVNVESGFDYTLFYQIGIVLLIVSLFLFYRHFQLARHNKVLKKQQNQLNKSNEELIKTKKRLEASIKDFEILINSVTEAIFIFEDDVCIDANNIAHKMYGYDSKDEIIGKNLKAFVPKETYKEIKKRKTNDDSTIFESKGIKKDGTIIDVLSKGTNAIINSKKVRISAVVDISETKQKEQLLFQQSKMASMGQMLENIAHQWRQPLSLISSISTAIELKKDLDISTAEDEKKELKKINSTAQHLSETIEDFRNFFKSDKKKVEFSILKTIDRSIELVEGVLKNNSITVIFEDVDDAVIKSYENEFMQALINIFYNAKDAFERFENEKYIFINLKKENNLFILKIKDNAKGIDETIIKNIFEPYFTTKHQAQGTGIGLYMTQMIVEKHMRGKIEVENVNYTYRNKKYSGAQFTFKIPV